MKINNTEIVEYDNFLTDEDFNDLCSIKLEDVKEDKIQVNSNSIDKYGNINSSCIPEDLIKRLQNNYHTKAIELLAKLSHEKVALYDHSEFYIIQTGANYSFPIHDDVSYKLLSGVIYLKPKENAGTFFHKNKKGEGSFEVTWKPNKGVFFSRAEKKTWHSYKGDGKSNRFVLVYNLMTDNQKEVYNIEKKSYFMGSLRSKINKIIFRYFKKLI